MEDAKGGKPVVDAKEAKRAKNRAELKMDVKVGIALLFIFFLGLSATLLATWQEPPQGTERLDEVTREIFSLDGLVVPFEILSVLLLAALIAGVVIALREPEGGN